jgi:hypothetical protein
VQPPTGASIERILPFPEDAELGHASPLFHLVTAGRLRLRPGERRDVPVVAFSIPTLLPEPRRLRWLRLPDVELHSAKAGDILAADYLLSPLEGPPIEARLSANLLGLPLRMRLQTPDGTMEWFLVE